MPVDRRKFRMRTSNPGWEYSGKLTFTLEKRRVKQVQEQNSVGSWSFSRKRHHGIDIFLQLLI